MTLTADQSTLAGQVRRLYFGTAGDDTQLTELARAHHSLARARQTGESVLGVFHRTARIDGRATATTVVQIVTEDLPGLLDSVVGELTRGGHRIRQVVSPVAVVWRDADHLLRSVFPELDPENPPPGAVVESWISVEIDRIGNADRARELQQRLTSVIDDVRAVAASGEEMREIARAVAAAVTDAGTGALLRWLADGHFTFLGYRFDDPLRTGDGLGLLRDGSSLVAGIPIPASGPGMILAPASGPSTVYCPGEPCYLGIRTQRGGRITGEHRFVGTFTASARHEDIRTIPVVSDRVEHVLTRTGVSGKSRTGQRMLEILEDLPRTELFAADEVFLHHIATGAPAPAELHQPRVFIRRDPHGRFFSCLVFLAAQRYTTAGRLAMRDVLRSELGGASVTEHVRTAGPATTMIHFVVHTDPRPRPEPDVARIGERLAATVCGWDERLVDAVLAGRHGESGTTEDARRYVKGFPEAYKEKFDAETGLDDLLRLRSLPADAGLDTCVYLPPGARQARFKLYLSGRRETLSEILSIVEGLGTGVLDEHSYEITVDSIPYWIFDFGLTVDRPEVWRDPAIRDRFEEAFTAVWRGDAESDRLNALVVRAGLDWRQAALLRAYTRYQHQTGNVHNEQSLSDALLAWPRIAAGLVRLFEQRFDPDFRGEDRENGTRELTRLIDDIPDPGEHWLLRGCLDLIHATVRTNYYCFVGTRNGGGRGQVLSLKLAGPAIPAPAEIFVYSPRLEGVHLRFGRVARGGLRWSDRRADYRTEILDLARAQAVRNSAIVPAGAHGGFVLTRPPADRDARRTEAEACYRMFVAGLLDLTDNIRDGQIVSPPRVLRYDGDDPYLVVTAGQGTFSAAANDIAHAYGFWLGDAFAPAERSNTAVVWESAGRHFHELGLDPEREHVTVAAIGDLSGAGMPHHVRLIAAFDDRHIFLDPAPDPAASAAERERLSGASLADYDPAKLSPGGGVWPRTEKAIPVNPIMRAALDLGSTVEWLSADEMVRAILLAPVDVQWHGGSGTYVKAATETHAATRVRDAVDAAELRAKIVAGNLGLTRRGRIEFARAGGHVVDDVAAIANSDREVNVKILLADLVAKGRLGTAERDELLAAVTGEPAKPGRRHRTLGVSRAHAARHVSVHARLVADLEYRHGLDRATETLPGEREFAALVREHQGLSSPELATVVAHTKNALKAELLASDLLTDPALLRHAAGYFPPTVRKRFPAAIEQHPLRREIAATVLVNEVVDHGGLTYVFRLTEDLAVDSADAVRAFAVVSGSYDLRSTWEWIEAAGEQLPLAVTDQLVLDTRTLLDRAARWLLSRRTAPLDVTAEIGRFRPVVRALRPKLGRLACGVARQAADERARQLIADHVPLLLATQLASLPSAYSLLDIAEIAELTGHSPQQTAEVYFAPSEHEDSRLRAVTIEALRGGAGQKIAG
ncbi:NAD-glutamate dehydrogenase domain-containing protein [Amycolatopsis pithecellobii]|uniref:NAD-glutamate dehydrogenase n=1 Tax=Amycolatopsis pithecellobii TaxID=664692 RepID=A0A6N7YKJ2_9PSEU|nr:NAD-glutamate dehydrogenase domain-containing protein [Amycolatopsis pithecellobii]MTD53407.1 NAD-glutamate dehydrogenase [Amycolatopsis pithecellobii]